MYSLQPSSVRVVANRSVSSYTLTVYTVVHAQVVLLHRALVISHGSTTLVEAVVLGIPSVFYKVRRFLSPAHVPRPTSVRGMPLVSSLHRMPV